MTLVNADELSAYMGGIEFDTNQTGILETVILPGTQQDLENYLNRPVEPVVVRQSVRPDDNNFLHFRVTPVHKVLSVALSTGSTVSLSTAPVPDMTDVDDYRQFDEWGDPDLFGYQLSGFSSYNTGYGYPTFGTSLFYRVEYIAGYNGYVNEALKLDILRVAAREAEIQFDDTMSMRGGASEAASRSDSREKGWTADELTKWDRLRRRTVA